MAIVRSTRPGLPRRVRHDLKAHGGLRVFTLVPDVYCLVPRTARNLALVKHVEVTPDRELCVVLKDLCKFHRTSASKVAGKRRKTPEKRAESS